MKEKKQKEDDILLAISAGLRYPISPNLVYEYRDLSIHEDLYKLIKYSCEEICSSKEQLNKVLGLWTSFVETMLGVSPQSRVSEFIEGGGDVGPLDKKDEVLTKEDGQTMVTSDGPVDNNKDDEPPSEVALAVQGNIGFAEGSRTNGYKENKSSEEAKNEKEEGELSPNNDFEQEVTDIQYQNGVTQDNDIINDADDEVSGNISEPDDDVSDECSREGDKAAESEGEAIIGEEEEEEEEEATNHFGGPGPVLSSDKFLQTSRPLTKHVASTLSEDEKNNSWVFYGNDTCYVLFRLHQVLYERLLSAKQTSGSSDSKWRNGKDNDSDSYARFMSALYSLLDGSSDNTKFEDDCRAIIGNQSYFLFTLDKLIYKLVKQLQIVSSEELHNKLLQLFEYEKSRRPEKYHDSVYYENAHVLLHDENIYRLERARVFWL